MSKVAFVHSENNGREELTLIFVEAGIEKTITSDHPAWSNVLAGLLADESEGDILALLNVEEPEEASTKGSLRQQRYRFADGTDSHLVVKDDGVLYCEDQAVEDCLAQELVSLEFAGLPTDGMVRFIERLYDSAINPNGKRVSSRVRSELLNFIKRNGIVIDSNGDIIAYKAVKEDYFDKHTGKTFQNSPGTRVWMDFGSVDDNAAVGCGRGLHAGSLDYVASFGWGNDRIVIVRIDPADVVSVPSDCSFQKLRTCAYTVIGDYQGELKRVVYEFTDNVDDMYDEDGNLINDYDEEDDFDWDSFEDLDDADVQMHSVTQEELDQSQEQYAREVAEGLLKYFYRRGPDNN